MIGVARDTWGQSESVVYPVRSSWGNPPEQSSILDGCPAGKHIIHLSLNWAKALESGFVGSCAEIGARVGLTDGRVRQVVRLASLHPKSFDF